MDDKTFEKKFNQTLGCIMLSSMMLGVAGWEIGKYVFSAIKMAVKGTTK